MDVTDIESLLPARILIQFFFQIDGHELKIRLNKNLLTNFEVQLFLWLNRKYWEEDDVKINT